MLWQRQSNKGFCDRTQPGLPEPGVVVGGCHAVNISISWPRMDDKREEMTIKLTAEVSCAG